jgi:hypothetical protein
MIRSLKALGLLTVAALAISAMVASAAQAEPLLTSGKTPETHTATKVHGVQEGTITENYFQTESGITKTQVSCENEFVKYYGSTTGSDKELTLEPTYGRGTPNLDCGVVIKEGEVHKLSPIVTVTMEGCNFKLKQPTFIFKDTYTGKVDLECPAGKDPLVHIYSSKAHTTTICTITIEPPAANQGLSHVIYHNQAGTPDDITATVEIEGIQYITRGAGCPAKDGTTLANGKFFTNITLTSGETNASKETVSLADDLWISGE